jgi:carbonic anhydrase
MVTRIPALIAILVFTAASAVPAQVRQSVTGAQDAGRLNADAALKRLKDGHARFLADKPAPRDLGMKQRVRLAMEQRPFAVILTCADSRVSPELIFDQGLGDLFVLRIAGNVSDPGIVGSIEYAVEHLRCPLIVVLGHESCGAVKAAMNLDEVHGNLGSLIEQVRLGKGTSPEPNVALNQAVINNAIHHAGELTYKSSVIKDAAASEQVQIVPGTYSLSTGDVTWLELRRSKGEKSGSH